MNGDDRLKLSARLFVIATTERAKAPLARHRLLMVAAQRKRSRVLKMSVWLPIAAAFVATTAWAGATGRFAPPCTSFPMS